MKSELSKPPAVERPLRIIRVSPVFTVPLWSSSITTNVLPSPLKLYCAYISIEVVGKDASAAVIKAAKSAVPVPSAST